MERLYTVKEASRRLRVCESTVRAMIRTGRLRAVRVAGTDRVVIPEDAFSAALIPMGGMQDGGGNAA